MSFDDFYRELTKLGEEFFNNREKLGRSNFVSGLIETLQAAEMHDGKLGPDFDSLQMEDGQMSYSKLLVDIGCFEEHGNKAQPIYYTITEKGRTLYSLLDN